MKTYQISEELLNEVITMLIDYQEDAEDLDVMGGIPNHWTDDITNLKNDLEKLEEVENIPNMKNYQIDLNVKTEKIFGYVVPCIVLPLILCFIFIFILCWKQI